MEHEVLTMFSSDHLVSDPATQGNTMRAVFLQVFKFAEYLTLVS